MWKHTAASVLALIASGCASMQMAQHTPIAAAFQMAPVGQAAPPAGLAEFCAREGDFCQAAGAPNQTEQASTGAAFQPAVSGEGGAALFRALLAAQIRERPDAQAAAIVRRVLTDADWRALESINRSVNWRITPATDMEIWHVEDRWSLP
ncbi:MAG: transglutaminase-like cysteine peptidase, partial [Hyphomonadaceae bacterium]